MQARHVRKVVFHRLCRFVLTPIDRVSRLSAEEPCRFPASWIDQWYWKDSVFNITENQLGSQGRCLQQQRDTKFLLQRDIPG